MMNMAIRPFFRVTKNDALAAHWSKVFNEVIDKTRAINFADCYVCKWSFKDTNIPSSSQIEHTIRNVRNSTPGVDGLPAAAWLSEAGVVTLFQLQCNIFCGIHPPICFNDACIVCPPKKVHEQVGLPVYREAHEARPLKIKKSDNRIIAAASHKQINRISNREAIPEQRGFTKNRQIMLNAIELQVLWLQ